MIVSCPNCNSRYNLTPAQIGPEGRTVRCTNCSESWFQKPLESEDGSVPPLPPEQESKDTDAAAVAAEKSAGKQRFMMVFGGVLVLLMLIGSAGFLVLQGNVSLPSLPVAGARTVGLPVAAIQPQPVTATGLRMGDISRRIDDGGALPVLIFEGTVTNTSQVQVRVPEVRVSLRDERGVLLDFWPAQVMLTELDPGQETAWKARFYNPDLSRISEFKAEFFE